MHSTTPTLSNSIDHIGNLESRVFLALHVRQMLDLLKLLQWAGEELPRLSVKPKTIRPYWTPYFATLARN
jgi:hypothetical protein